MNAGPTSEDGLVFGVAHIFASYVPCFVLDCVDSVVGCGRSTWIRREGGKVEVLGFGVI